MGSETASVVDNFGRHTGESAELKLTSATATASGAKLRCNGKSSSWTALPNNMLWYEINAFLSIIWGCSILVVSIVTM
jgi:hypothetical protein